MQFSAPELLHRYRAAVAMLRIDRPAGLRGLESCFAAGSVPDRLDGRLRGRLLATTVGHGVDAVSEALAGYWMPWLGKTFDAERAEGRNVFTAGGRRAIRLTMPTYRDIQCQKGDHCTAFRFLTSTGGSAIDAAVQVLRIDYRDITDNPGWPVRRVLDELVAVDSGVYLGQALLWWRGAMRRAAWFELIS
jgi:hypothetical protein